MLELLKFVLSKLNFLEIIEALRKRKNRRAAARLHLILIQVYEFIELYEILIDELRAALRSHQKPNNNKYRFFLNAARISNLLERQSSNVQILEQLILDLLCDVRLLDNRFAQALAEILPGKSTILMQAQALLSNGRLPLAETGPGIFPKDRKGVFRTLWFNEPPESKQKRVEIEKYLYGWNGKEKKIIDVNVKDGDLFFRELASYLKNREPYERLNELKKMAKNYKKALVKNFSLQDVLSDLEKVQKHDNWAKQRIFY